jgi:hypothetical protein
MTVPTVALRPTQRTRYQQITANRSIESMHQAHTVKITVESFAGLAINT